mmetsp:Transcript_12790/g.37149  ORF Transcript_12790/g.37149 Transcript_12790/m.37149 type:complete len:239 (+) Transcript_12790:498-1214(+)
MQRAAPPEQRFESKGFQLPGALPHEYLPKAEFHPVEGQRLQQKGVHEIVQHLAQQKGEKAPLLRAIDLDCGCGSAGLPLLICCSSVAQEEVPDPAPDRSCIWVGGVSVSPPLHDGEGPLDEVDVDAWRPGSLLLPCFIAAEPRPQGVGRLLVAALLSLFAAEWRHELPCPNPEGLGREEEDAEDVDDEAHTSREDEEAQEAAEDLIRTGKDDDGEHEHRHEPHEQSEGLDVMQTLEFG